MDCLLFTCRLISTTEFDQFAGCLIDCLYLDHKRNFLCLIMQMPFLEEWAVLDRDHSSSLLGATEALRASTLRLPVVEKAIVCVIQFFLFNLDTQHYKKSQNDSYTWILLSGRCAESEGSCWVSS